MILNVGSAQLKCVGHVRASIIFQKNLLTVNALLASHSRPWVYTSGWVTYLCCGAVSRYALL